MSTPPQSLAGSGSTKEEKRERFLRTRGIGKVVSQRKPFPFSFSHLAREDKVRVCEKWEEKGKGRGYRKRRALSLSLVMRQAGGP